MVLVPLPKAATDCDLTFTACPATRWTARFRYWGY
jgi:hypothetical protein